MPESLVFKMFPGLIQIMFIPAERSAQNETQKSYHSEASNGNGIIPLMKIEVKLRYRGPFLMRVIGLFK